MKNPIESIRHFCLIQLELLNQREFKLRKEIEDHNIQREFLMSLLNDLEGAADLPSDLMERMLNTHRRSKS